MAPPTSKEGSDTQPNKHLMARISVSRSSEVGTTSRTELDSHANMVVLGSDCFIFENTGRSCTVHPFSSDLGSARDVPIVDAALAYDCQYTGETIILLVRNALYIPTMENNLIPPFVMRSGGVQVNDKPKIQCDQPTVEDHSLSFPDSDIRIPLQLHGVFSYFPTRRPTESELEECQKVFITPDSQDWNPHCQSYDNNERSMLDFEGNMAENDRRSAEKVVFEDEDDNPDAHVSSATVPIATWNQTINATISSAFISSPYAAKTDMSLDHDFCEALNIRGEISKLCASIGSCNISDDNSLFDLRKPSISRWEDIESSLRNYLDEGSIKAVEAEIASTQASRSKGVTKETLSKIWLVSEDLAQGAIDKNTQLVRHSEENTLSRQYSTNDRMLRYKKLQSVFYTDTMHAKKHKSTRGNICCQVFVSDKGYIAVYPMKSQEEFQSALHWFCKEDGVPTHMVMDGHNAQNNSNVRKFSNQVGMTLRILERATPWANRAELYIGLLKEAVRKDMRASNSPMVLWDYAMERRALIHNVIPRPLFQAQGKTPTECTLGISADISNICNFGWYEWVYYRDFGSFPENKEKLGRVLGPCKNEGSEMSQSILNFKGNVITRRTVRKLRSDELHSESEKQKRASFDDRIRQRLGDSISKPVKPEPPDHVPYSDDYESNPLQLPDDNDPVDENGVAVFEKPITDQWINAELNLPQGEELRKAKVIGRTTDENGRVIGTYDQNPFLNTTIYNVQFPDGEVKEYAANVIAENLYSQVDDEGHTIHVLDAIVDYRRDGNAVDKADMYISTRSGQRRMRHTTSGWHLLVQWKNGEEEWMPLKLLKESYPVETATFAVARGIQDEPAFKWWVPYTLRRRDRIIASVNSRVSKVSHKYGVELPRSVQHAKELDEKNGNTLWNDAINKEMGNLKVAFDIIHEPGRKPPPTYTKTSGHMVFDVRMTLERKARWVKDGHKTPEPEWSTYAGVVSRESVRIALTYAALMDLNVCACDI